MLTSLTKIVSDNDDRPTYRRYIDKHGNLSWMETAKINESDKTDEDQSELDFDIAKLCRVSNQFVGKISLGIVPSYKGSLCHFRKSEVTKAAGSLGKIPSENYERPTRRRYIDKHGNLSWMETAKINESDKTDEDQSELDFDIAKLCRVSNQFVGKISLGIVPSYKGSLCHFRKSEVTKAAESLEKFPSENYTRPTLRRHIDKHGNESWMETVDR